MSMTEECRAALEQLMGQQLATVHYVGLSYDPGTEVRWDYGSWHHPEVGVELTTTSGDSFFGIWDSKVTHFELTFACGNIAEEWLPSRDGTARAWDVSTHPRWLPLLASPIAQTGVSTAEPDDPPVRAPIAVRLANDLTEVWIAAAGPRHPPVGDPPAPDAMWIGFDEVVVLFDRAEALALGLTDE